MKRKTMIREIENNGKTIFVHFDYFEEGDEFFEVPRSEKDFWEKRKNTEVELDIEESFNKNSGLSLTIKLPRKVRRFNPTLRGSYEVKS